MDEARPEHSTIASKNYDGDEVATVILRRSKKNSRLAANLHRYLSLASIEAAAERLANVSTRSLPEVARQTRARRRAEFNAWLELQRTTDAVKPDEMFAGA